MPGTLVIGGDPVEPVLMPAMGSIFDGLVTRLLGSVKWNWRKLDPKELKAAVNAIGTGLNECVTHAGNALKPAIDAPLGADDALINKAVEAELAGNAYLVKQMLAEIDFLFPSGGGFNAPADLTTIDVDNYLDALGANDKAMSGSNAAPVFNAQCINMMKANPQVIRLLQKTTHARQIRAATDPTFMQKVIDFLFKYGPYLAQILSVLLLFI